MYDITLWRHLLHFCCQQHLFCDYVSNVTVQDELQRELGAMSRMLMYSIYVCKGTKINCFCFAYITRFNLDCINCSVFNWTCHSNKCDVSIQELLTICCILTISCQNIKFINQIVAYKSYLNFPSTLIIKYHFFIFS